MRVGLLGLVVIGVLVIAMRADAQDWHAAFEEWAVTHTQAASAYDAAKKRAADNEKNFKDISDKAFQNSFDQVFGSGNFKPSEALDLMKVAEAASYGDYKVAGEGAGDLAIARFAPGLGQYIALMKATASGIKATEQVWINGLMETKAYKSSLDILFKQPTSGSNAYIPSYLLAYLQNNPAYGDRVKSIYKDMRSREAKMYDEWMQDEAAVDQLLLGGWASRWISAMGKVPTQHQMFNYFLHKNTSEARAVYMRRFREFYLQPMLEEQARAEKKRISAAMNRAVQDINEQVGQGDANAKACKDARAQLQKDHAEMISLANDVHADVARLQSLYDDKYKKLYEDGKKLEYMPADFRKGFATLLDMEKTWLASRDDIRAYRAKLDAADAAFQQTVNEVLPLKTTDPAAYNARLPAARAQERQLRTLRQNYNSAWEVYEAGRQKYQTLRDKLQAYENRLGEHPGADKLAKDFAATQASITQYQRGEAKCTAVMNAARSDEAEELLKRDFSVMYKRCNQLVATQTKLVERQDKLFERCEPVD